MARELDGARPDLAVSLLPLDALLQREVVPEAIGGRLEGFGQVVDHLPGSGPEGDQALVDTVEDDPVVLGYPERRVHVLHVDRGPVRERRGGRPGGRRRWLG